MKKLLLTASVLGLLPLSNAHADLRVVASIKPIHALVAEISDGVFTPELLLPANVSPHHFNLKPSQAKQLSNADVIVWVGEDLEQPLEKAINTLAPKAENLELMALDTLKLLPYREWKTAQHDDHHDEHEHEKHDHKEHEHEHEKHHDTHDDHDHGGKDAHIWLSPENALKIAREITNVLSAKDPKNADRYSENFTGLIKELDEVDRMIRLKLTQKADIPYYVLHDAYQYFEAQYGLKPAGVINTSVQTKPGAYKIKEIIKETHDHSKVCFLTEPQLNDKTLKLAAQQTNSRIATIDPLGTDIPAGKGFYRKLLEDMANSYLSCFNG